MSEEVKFFDSWGDTVRLEVLRSGNDSKIQLDCTNTTKGKMVVTACLDHGQTKRLHDLLGKVLRGESVCPPPRVCERPVAETEAGEWYCTLPANHLGNCRHQGKGFFVERCK